MNIYYLYICLIYEYLGCDANDIHVLESESEFELISKRKWKNISKRRDTKAGSENFQER